MNNTSLYAGISDEDLAQKAAQGTQECFEILVRRNSGRVYRFFQMKISGKQEIEDLVQETFLKLYRNIQRYDPKWKFSTWMYTAARRLAISRFRKRQDNSLIPDFEGIEIHDPTQNIIEKKEEEAVQAAVRSLNNNQREAVWLRYFGGMSTAEIGKIMNKRPAAVRILLHRGKLNLAKILSEAAENSGKILSSDSRLETDIRSC